MLLKRLLAPLLALLLIWQLTLPGFVLASESGGSGGGTPVNLDLSSTERSVAASSYSGLTSAVIQVGQSARTVTGSDFLTAAESIALQQVLAGGQQSLLLGDQGHAIGGSFNLSSGIGSGMLSGLVVPTGVTAIHDFGLVSNLNLTGNFNNAGNFYAISSNSAVTAANISALNIFNQAGGLLSSVLPAGGLSGYSNLVGALSLNLTAINDIINSGSIMSSANLSAIAGGSIINSSIAGQNMAIMQAAQNLNLQAVNIANSGLLAAQLGNMNIATQQITNNALMQSLNGNINILNSLNPASGLALTQSNTAVMEALNGAINFNVVDPALKAAMSINGGSLLAQELNFNNGDGNLNVNLKDIAGAVNVNTGIANFAVTQGTHGMNIQSFNITGDPNLVYTGTGAYSSAAFNSLGGYVDINTSSDTSNGSITFTGTINTTPGASGNGGYVRLNAGTFINTQDITTSGNTTGNGGHIFLTAQGNITTGNLTVSGGATSGDAGDISINAGTSGTGNISLGNVTAANSTGTSNFSAVAPGTLTINTMSIKSDIRATIGSDIQIAGIAGGLVALESTGGDITISTTGINTVSLTGSRGQVWLSANNGDISVTGAISTNGSVGADAVFISGNNVSMPTGDINANGPVANTSGAWVAIFAQQDINVRNINTNSGATTGTAGSVQLHAGNSGTGNLTVLNINGSGSSGNDFIDITAPGIVSVGNITHNVTVADRHSKPITIIAGTAGTSLAPAQSGTLNVGNISNTVANATLLAEAGAITIINMGTNGNIVTGTITSTVGNNGISQGVAIVAHGTVTTGAINTGSASGSSSGGSVFISSGAAGGVAVTTNGITTNAGGGNDGDIWVIRNAGTSSNLGTITSGSGVLFDGAPTTPVTDITGNTTLTISPGAVTGYNPGGFTTVNAAGSTLTVNTSTSAHPIIPLFARSGNFVIGTVAINNNTADSTPLIITTAGNISIGTAITDTSGLSNISLYSTVGSIALPNLNQTTTEWINIAGSQGVSLANGLNIVADDAGTRGGLINISSAGGSILLGTANNQTNNSLNASDTSGGRVQLISRGDIIDYSVDLLATSTTGPGGQVLAISLGGDITLYNLYATSLGTNYSANVDVRSTGGSSGGLIVIQSVGDISVLRDNSVCCGLTTNQQFVSTGSSNGVIVIESRLDALNLADSSAILANTGAASGTIVLSSFGNLSIAAQVLTTGSVALTTGGMGASGNFSNNITAGSFSLSAYDSAGLTFSGGTITCSTINISTAFGDLGTSGARAQTAASTLNVSSTGTGIAYLSNTGVVSLASLSGNIDILNTGNINLPAAATGTTINLGTAVAGNTITLNGGITAASTISLQTTSLTLAAGITVSSQATSGTGISIGTGGVATGLSIIGTSGSTGTFSTAGANIAIAGAAGRTVTFNRTAAGATTLNFNGGSLSLTSTNDTIITSSVIVASDNSINFNVGGNAFTNNGTLRTSQNAGSITIQGTNGFALAGLTPGAALSFTGTGANILTIQLDGVGSYFFNNNITFSPGTDGTVRLNATSGSIFISSNTSVTAAAGADLIINASSITLSTAATINTSGNGTVTLNSTGTGLTITTANNSTGTITTGGGAITIAPDAGRNLTFSKSIGVNPTSLLLNGGPVAINTSGAGAITINSTVTVQSNNSMIVNMGGATLTNNGTIRSTQAAGSLQIVSSTALTLAGAGSYLANGAGATILTISASGANTLAISGSNTFTANSVSLNAQSVGGAITVAASAVQSLGGTTAISTPSLSLGNNSAFNGSTVNLSPGSGTAITVTVDDAATSSITGGAINFVTGSGQSVVLNKAAGAGTSTLNLTGGTVNSTATGGGGFAIGSGLTVVNNWIVTLTNNGGGATTIDGIFFSSNGGGGAVPLIIDGTSGFTVNGTGQIQCPGCGGSSQMHFRLNGAGTMTIGGSWTITGWTEPHITALDPGANVIIAPNSDVNLGAWNVIQTPHLSFGANSRLRISGNIFGLDSGGAALGMRITVPDGSSAEFNTTLTPIITVGAGQDFIFDKAAGSNPGTINLTGAAWTFTTTGNVSVANNVTVASNNTLAFNVNGGTLTNNGTITSSLAGGSTIVQSTGALTIGGTGSMTQTGGGAGADVTIAAAGANALTLNGTQTLHAGAAGSVILNSTNAAGSIVFGAGSAYSVSNGTALTIGSPAVTFGDLASLSASGNSVITLNSGGGANPLTITLPDNSSATIATSGTGTINFTPTAGRNLVFAKSAGVNTTILNLNDGATNTTTSGAGTTNINADVLLRSNNNITMTSNGQLINNNGTVRTIANGGTILLQGTTGFGLGGTGIYDFTGTGTNAMTIQLNGAGTLNLNSDNTFNPGDGGTVNINAQNAAGIVSVGANADLLADSGSNLVISTPSLTLGATSTLSTNGDGTITLNSGGGATNLTVTSPDASSTTISTAGGAINLTPTAGRNVAFAKSAGAGTTTLNLNGGQLTVTTSGAGTITVNASVTVQTNNNIALITGGQTITNNGTVRTTMNGGAISLQGTNGFGLGGAGLYDFTGGGATSMTVQLNGAGTLTFSGDTIFSPGEPGVVNINATAGTVALNANVDITAAAGADLTINASQLNFGNSATLNTSGNGIVTLMSTGTALTVQVNNNQSGSINTGGGNINITPAAGNALNFTKTAGVNPGTLNLNGGTTFTTTSGAGITTVNTNVVLQSNNNISITSNGQLFTNSGTVRTTAAGGSITVQGTNGFGLSGTGAYSFTGGGVTSMVVQLNGAGTLALNSDVSFSPGDPGTVTINAQDAAGIVALAANVDVTAAAGADLVISTSNLTFGNTSSLVTSGNGTVTISSGANPLTITSPDGSSALITTGGGAVNMNPAAGQNLVFAKSAGAGMTALSVNGSALSLTASAPGTITVNAGVILQSNNNITITSDGAALTNNGTIRTTAAGGSILLQGTNGFGLAGSGTYDFTGGGATSMTVQLNGAGTLSLNSDVSFSPGDPGTVNISAQNAAGIIVLGANADITAAGGADLVISSPNLTFGNTSTLNASGNGTITINSGGANPLTITSPDASSALIITGGGAINITPSAGQNLVFAKTAGAGTTTLNVNGSALSLTASAPGTITVNASVILQSNSNITVTSNGVAITNNGTIRTILAGGNILLQGTNGFGLAGTGSYDFTGGGATSMTVQLNGAGTLSLNSDTTFSPGDPGTVNINAQDAAGIIALGASADITAAGGANLVVSSPGLVFGNSSTLNTSGNGTVTVNSGGANPLTITSPDGSSASIITGGGAINITPTAGQALIFAKTAGAGTTTLNFNGANLTTTTTAATTVNAGVTLATNSGMTFNVNGSTFTNNGALSGSGAGSIVVQSTGTLSFAGNGSITQSSTGTITIQTSGAALLTLSGTHTFSQDSGFRTAINASNAAGSILLSDNTSLTSTNSNASIALTTPAIQFGNNTSITDNSTIFGSSISSPGGSDLTITLPDSGSVSISTPAAANFDITAAQNVVFAKTAGAGTATMNFTNSNHGRINVNPGFSATINSGVILTSTKSVEFNMNGGNLINNGTLTSTTATGYVDIVNGSGTLNISGTGNFGTSTTELVFVRAQANSVVLNFASSLTLTSSATGAVMIDNNFSLGTVSTSAGVTLSLNQGSGSNIFRTAGLTLGAGSTVTSNTGLSLQGANGAAMTITAPDSSSAVISTSGGSLSITPAVGQNLVFAKSAGAGTTTLNFNGAPLSMSVSLGGAVTVNAGVTVQANNNITITSNGASVTNNGTIRTALAGGSILLQGTNGFGLAGTGIYDFSGGGATSMTVQLNGAGTLALNSDTTFSPGDSGTVNINAQNATGIIALGANADITAAGGADLVISSPNLTFGNTSTLNTSGNGTITVNSGGANPLTVTSPDGSSASIITAGGAINITPSAGQNLVFAKTAGAGSATLNVNGSALGLTASAPGTITVNSNVILQSNNNITITSNGVAITNNGMIRTTLAGGSILLQGTNGFGLAGTGGYDFTGGGATSMTVQLNGAGTLALNSDTTFSPGDPGTVNINAQNAAGVIALGVNADITAAGGADLVISSPNLTFGNTSTLNTSGNGTITINSGGASPITITSPDSSSASIITGGGAINITPTAGQALTFAKSAGAGTTTLSFNGADLTVSASAATNINTGVILASNQNINMTVNGATLTNNGVIQTSLAHGVITLQGTNGFAFAGAGNVTFTTTGNNVANVQLNGAGTMTVSSHTFNFNSLNGTLNLNAQNAAGNLAIGAGANVAVDNGAITVSTPNLSFGNSSSIAGGLNSNISFNSGGANPLTITSPDGSTAAVSTGASGTITIAPAANQSVTFAKSAGAGSTTLNFTVPTLTLNTTNAVVGINASTTVATSGVITFTIDNGTLNNAGILTTSATSAGPVNIQSNSGNLAITGGGTIASTGAGNLVMSIRSSAVGSTLNLSGSQNYSTAGLGAINLYSSTAGGSINVAPGVTQAALGNTIIVLTASNVTLGNGSTLSGSRAGAGAVLLTNTVGDLTVTLADGGSATLNGGAGYGGFQTLAGTNLLITKTAGAGTATLNHVGTNAFYATTTDGVMTIDPNVIISSDAGGIWLQPINSTFVNNGTLTSNGTLIRIHSTSGTLTMNGTPNTVSLTGGVFGNIQVTGSDVVFNTNYTFNPGPSGLVTIGSTSPIGTTTIASGLTITSLNQGGIHLIGPNYVFGNGVLMSATATAGIGFTTSAGVGANVTYTMPDAGSVTWQTAGGSFSINPPFGFNLQFTKSAGAGTTTLNMVGGNVLFNSNTATITVQPSVIIAAQGNITYRLQNNSTFANNGIITTSANNGNMLIDNNSSAGAVFGGTGIYQFTGGGSPTVTSSINGAGRTLTITGTPTFSTGASGSITLTADVASGGFVFAANANPIFTAGIPITISTPSLTFGNNSALSGSGNSAIVINSGGASGLTITAPDASSATISTGVGGSISIAPTAGQTLTFAKSAGAGTTTLDINGAAVTVTTSAATAINAGVTVASNNSITMNINGTILTNNGVLSSSATGNSMTVQSTGTLTLAGTGSYTQANGTPGSTRFIATSGTLSLANNAGISVTGNGSVSISSPTLSFGNSSSLTATGVSSAITVDAGGVAGTLTITAPDASSATLQAGSSGTLTITPTAGQNLVFNKSAGAGSATLNLVSTGLTINNTGNSTTVAASTIVSSPVTMTVNTASITNGGTISTTGAVGSNNITVLSASSLTLAGSGAYSTVSGSVNFTATGANPINVTGNLTANVNAGSGVSFSTQNAAGSIVLGNGASIAASNALTLTTNNLTLGNASSITSGTGLLLSPAVGVANLTITLPDSSSATIQATAPSLFIIGNVAGRDVNFVKSAGAGSTTLNLNGSPVFVNSAVGANVNIAANVTVTSNNNLTFNVHNATFTNNGTARSTLAGGTLAVQGTSGNLAIAGGGTIDAANLNFNSTSGSVTATQGTIVGTLQGSAATSFATTATGSGLAVNDITATNGILSLTAGGGILNATAGADLTSTQNMTLTGQTGVTLGAAAGAAVTATAGTVAGNATSTNMADYTYASITSPASVMITSNTGNVVINDNVSLSARGNSVGVTSANDITLGTGNSFFAQGGNVWFDAVNNFALPAGNAAAITAVARTVPGTVTIGGQTVPDFVGGGIAIYAGNPGLNLDAALRTAQLARVPAGTTVIDPGVNIAGTTLNLSNGGTISLTAPGAGKIGAINSTFNVDGGVLLIDPPGDQIDINSLTLNVFGQGLAPAPPPPTPSVDPVVVAPQPVSNNNAGAVVAPQPATTASIISTDVENNSASQPADSAKQSQNSNLTFVQPGNYNGWIVTSNVCQPFIMQGDDLALVADAGTEFAPTKNNSIVIKQGRMLAMAGKMGATIETAQGILSVPKESAVIIEQKTNGLVRVATISGSPSSLALNNAINGGSNGSGGPNGGVSANKEVLVSGPGEEIVVGDSTLGEEELIPVDGVERSPIEGSINVAGLRVEKKSFSMKSMAERERTLRCNMSYLHQFNKKMDSIKKGMLGFAQPVGVTSPKAQKPSGNITGMVPSSSKANTGKTSPSKYSPVAYSTQPVTFTSAAYIGAGQLMHGFDTGATSIKHCGDARVKVDSKDHLTLTTGTALVIANKLTAIKAGKYEIVLQPNTIAVVTIKKEIVKVRNVYEAGSGSIRAYAGKAPVSIGIGNEVVLGAGDVQPMHHLSGDSVGRRRIKTFELAGGHNVMSSEISIVSLMQQEPVLKNLVRSAKLSDKALSQKLIKTAACLSQVTSGHGAYSIARQK